MRNIFGIIITSLIFNVANAQDLKLEDITSGKYRAYGVAPMTSSEDGEFYYQSAAKNTLIVKYSYKTGLVTDTIFDTKKARGCSFNSFEGFIISPDEKRVLLYNDSEKIYRRSFKANYYYYDIRRNLLRRLTENTSKQMIPTFSHDGRMAAFVVDNNIWLAKFDYDTESQVTKDGVYGKIINGATDWVYEEEFTTTSLIDFSANNRLLSFVRFDETEVPLYQMQTYNGQLYPQITTFKYPKTGEKNSKVSVHVFDIEAMTTRKIAISESNTEYIPRIHFLPQGDDLAIMTLNREQNIFTMYYANARSTVARQILREENERYIDSELLSRIRFFNNRFTYVSEKTGYSHIYLYDNNGVLQKQLTSGDYDVTDLLAVDEEKGIVYYQAADDSPLTRTINKVDINKGTRVRLSNKKGYNTAIFSNKAKYYLNSFTNTLTPLLTTIHDASGKELRLLNDNAKLKDLLASNKFPSKEFISVKGENGTDLNAYIMKPSDFDASRKYPLLMVQYSGPNSQQVLDRYLVDWTDYLVSQGFIVACVDGRGTGARGEDFRKCTYLNLGIKESDDQIAVAKYLSKQPYIDKNKIAIWGWSYGGYNVLMCMSRGHGIFKAGVAIAPVTSWKFYDTIYGERFMRTPQQNMSGYEAGSPINLANKLEGNLLLIHGSSDDNVHFQNTMEYTNALIKANKQFDLFIFPDNDHSIKGADNRTYLYNKIVSFLKRSLI